MRSGSPAYLNMTAGAWRQLRRAWDLPWSPLLLWQSMATGPVLSAINKLQRTTVAKRAAGCDLAGSVFIVGYWRSGTTLLHELLCNDPRYTFPTTYACMNPHHFMMTQPSQPVEGAKGTKRPMDDLVVHAGSPQEDEFALLGLGARSPYEAFLTPSHLEAAMALGDPRGLTGSEQEVWKSAFLGFLRGVSYVGGNLPIIVKSPTHSYRIDTIRKLVPDARFVLIVRDPLTVFESVVRMWRTMMTLYALEPVPTEDEIREVILAERPRFEARLADGRAGLPTNRFAEIRYEALAFDPVSTIERLYALLELGDFDQIRPAIESQAKRHVTYQAKNEVPSGPWQERVEMAWSDIRAFYGYNSHP